MQKVNKIDALIRYLNFKLALTFAIDSLGLCSTRQNQLSLAASRHFKNTIWGPSLVGNDFSKFEVYDPSSFLALFK